MKLPTITRSTGGTTSDRVYFSWITKHAPTRAEVTTAQIVRGFHPAGYDGPWNIATVAIGSLFETTWNCAANCD